jgi:hypothetical protein
MDLAAPPFTRHEKTRRVETAGLSSDRSVSSGTSAISYRYREPFKSQ